MASGNGVAWYTKKIAHIPVYFPEDKVCCAQCVLFCRYEEAYRRYSCRLTYEPLLHPFDEVGHKCPLFDDEGGSDNA